MERIEQIEMYLEGQLQGADLTDFEQEMQKDAALQSEVAEYKELVQGIRLAGQNQFVHLVHTWEKELAAADVLAEKGTDIQQAPQQDNGMEYGTKIVPIQPVKANPFKWLYQVAAAAVVLVLIGVGIMQFVGGDNSNQLFDKNFEHFESTLISREDTASVLTTAIELYNKKDYAAANTKFDDFLAKDPNNVIVSLYAGVSHLAVGETDKSIPLFQKVIADQNENFAEPAMWYLALAYLKNKDKDNAVKMLEMVRNTPGHENREAAKSILRKMKAA